MKRKLFLQHFRKATATSVFCSAIIIENTPEGTVSCKAVENLGLPVLAFAHLRKERLADQCKKFVKSLEILEKTTKKTKQTL